MHVGGKHNKKALIMFQMYLYCVSVSVWGFLCCMRACVWEVLAGCCFTHSFMRCVEPVICCEATTALQGVSDDQLACSPSYTVFAPFVILYRKD